MEGTRHCKTFSKFTEMQRNARNRKSPKSKIAFRALRTAAALRQGAEVSLVEEASRTGSPASHEVEVRADALTSS